jgi:hypothetical protein
MISFSSASRWPGFVATGSTKQIATSVKLHRARRWHLQDVIGFLRSTKREPPRDKPVASKGKMTNDKWQMIYDQ